MIGVIYQNYSALKTEAVSVHPVTHRKMLSSGRQNEVTYLAFEVKEFFLWSVTSNRWTTKHSSALWWWCYLTHWKCCTKYCLFACCSSEDWQIYRPKYILPKKALKKLMTKKKKRGHNCIQHNSMHIKTYINLSRNLPYFQHKPLSSEWPQLWKLSREWWEAQSPTSAVGPKDCDPSELRLPAFIAPGISHRPQSGGKIKGGKKKEGLFLK